MQNKIYRISQTQHKIILFRAALNNMILCNNNKKVIVFD